MHEKTLPLVIDTASEADCGAALRLVFGHLSDIDAAGLVASLLKGKQAGEIVFDGLLAARRGPQLVGAVWMQTQPGASAVVWPPRILPDEPESTAAALLEAVDARLASSSVRMAQAMLPHRDGEDAARVTAAGFTHLTDLAYLAAMEAKFPLAEPVSPLTYETYSPANHRRLVNAIRTTYQQTRDCPQLNGVRDIEDTLQGYRATGVFDAGRWLLVQHEGRDIGCLLLADHPGADQWELIYMGIAPSVRGRGFGVTIARHAQWLTRLARRSRLILAVDMSNQPALDMYTQAGFFAWQTRSVFVRVLEQAA